MSALCWEALKAHFEDVFQHRLLSFCLLSISKHSIEFWYFLASGHFLFLKVGGRGDESDALVQSPALPSTISNQDCQVSVYVDCQRKVKVFINLLSKNFQQHLNLLQYKSFDHLMHPCWKQLINPNFISISVCVTRGMTMKWESKCQALIRVQSNRCGQQHQTIMAVARQKSNPDNQAMVRETAKWSLKKNCPGIKTQRQGNRNLETTEELYNIQSQAKTESVC